MLNPFLKTCLIVSITKSSIVNGSPTICRIIGEQSRVCPIRGVRFELFVIGYHVIFTSITCALIMTSIANVFFYSF